MKRYIIIAFLWFGPFLFAQTTINQYHYVIVPSTFSFTKEIDQYRLNTLTKLLLQKYGFKAYLDTDQLPEDIIDSNCNKLFADAISSGNFIMTKIKIVLKDCKNNVLYESGLGKSKEKEFNIAYNKAFREAFQSFETLQYQYKPVDDTKKVEASIKETTVIRESFEDNNNPDLLYAQPISNGYQLVDTTPKIIMKIFKTSNPHTFSALKGTTQGVLISKDNQWFFEYYKVEKLISEKINVKF